MNNPPDQDPARRPWPSILLSQRHQLITIAYRLLGSVADAELAVQETYTRWYALPANERRAIESVPVWLSTIAHRVCRDQLSSARAEREEDFAPWPGEVVRDPADRITLDESIDMALLVLLETMSPVERVTFLLHDVFRYTFADVASVVGRTPAGCRHLASVARHRIRTNRPVERATSQRTDET